MSFTFKDKDPKDIKNRKRKRVSGRAKKLHPNMISKDCPECGSTMYFMPDDDEYMCNNCGHSESVKRK